MAASATTQEGHTTEAQRKIMEGEAYADFVACEVEGMTRAERATQTGKTASTVSAAIRRIEERIAKGDIPDPRTGDHLTGGGGRRTLDRKDVAEQQLEGASMFVEQLDRLDAEAERIRGRMTRLTLDLEEIEGRHARMRGLAEKAGFNWDEFDAAVASTEDSE